MSRAQMAERCPNARFVGLGRLPGYQLVFNRMGRRYEGAVASIESSSAPNAAVHGVIWEIDKAELNELDQIEGPSAYQRHTLQAELDGHEWLECEVYIGISQGENFAPDSRYLEILIEAAQDVGLPFHYVQSLERFRECAI